MLRTFCTVMILLIGLIGCGLARQPLPLTNVATPEEKRTPAPGIPSSPVSPSRITPGVRNSDVQQGTVYLDLVELLVRESHPPQVELSLSGYLPTPCHVLRVAVNSPDEQGRIFIEVYSVEEEGKICAQVLSPFHAQVPLESYMPGHYIVLVNGKVIGEFDV